MLSNLFKKSKLQVFSPVLGKIIPLEEVPDPVFSEKMMGEGVAVMPEEGNVYAPVDGKVIQVATTKHAVGILAKDGSEILIHVGLDTVALKGEGFITAVKVGDKVSVGDLLIEVDWKFIRKSGKSTITPVVITNSNQSKKQYTVTEKKVGEPGKTVILTSQG